MMDQNMASRAGKRASDQPLPAPAPVVPDHPLEAAIAAGEPTLLFQPQIETFSGCVIGVEALARWKGAASADKLFERAARTGLSERLSRLMQQRAVQTAARWTGSLSELKISVNLLPEDLARPGYETWLLREIENAELDPERLTVEITESALLVAESSIVDRLAALRSHGIRVALDDFGAGFASLSYLARLPLDVLKIDRSLVANIETGPRDRIVLQAIARLAEELGLQLVIEGVENAAQLHLLAQWGCRTYQGFLGAEALSEDELERFVRTCGSGAA